MVNCASFRKAITAANEAPISDWCARNVQLPYGSSRAPTYSPDVTPWVKEPLEEIFDNANSEIVLRAPVGSGKSTMIEALMCYIVAEDPGPTLITAQTDPDICDWAETRLWPVLKTTEASSHLFPTDRSKIRKSEVIFPHMPVWLTGANMSGLQSKSIRWLLGDEVWMWKRGMLEEFRNRMHRRWNGRRLLLGQCGVEEDDFSTAWGECEQREWSFACLSCGAVQGYSWTQLKFPDKGTASERAAECGYHCIECDHRHEDETKVRREMCESARYIVTKEGDAPGHIGFHYNVLTIWESPWRDSVAKWLNAQEARGKGNQIPFMQFIQKELAEDWRDDLSIDRPDLPLYLLGDGTPAKVEEFAKGEKIGDEHHRYCTIDVQRDHFWVKIRAWRADASSVGIYYGRINTEETVAELIDRYGVSPQHVYIDTGYDSGRVYDIICRYNWCGIRGDKAKRYKHKVKGKTVERPYSPMKYAIAPCGKRARYFFVATDTVKDMLASLRAGDGARWEILDGLHKSYAEQLDSEVREEFLTAKENQSDFRWVRKKRDNHAWDNEVYQVGAALVWRLFGD